MPLKLGEQATAKFNEALSSPDFKGELLKQSSSKRWKKRWVILKDHYIFYGKLKHPKAATGIINVYKGSVSAIGASFNNCPSSYTFSVFSTHSVNEKEKATNTTFFFACTSESSMRQWVRMLQEATHGKTRLSRSDDRANRGSRNGSATSITDVESRPSRNHSISSAGSGQSVSTTSSLRSSVSDISDISDRSKASKSVVKSHSTDEEKEKMLRNIKILKDMFAGMSTDWIILTLKKNDLDLDSTVQDLLENPNAASSDFSAVEYFEQRIDELRKEHEQLQKAKVEIEQERKRLEAAQEKKPKCVVCIEEDISVCFDPCKHVCVCSECADSLDQCPLCRSEIDDFFTVYLA